VLDHLDERFAGRVLDYGGGNGELTKMIVKRFPKAQVVCYEPSLQTLTEAQENLDGLKNIVLISSLKGIEHASFDYVFCLEVFEHLPWGQTTKAIKRINRLLSTSGVFIVGVPNELYVMALLKGAFRMKRAFRTKRRFRNYATRPRNIFRAAIGKPPTDRPRKRLGPGLPYHHHHVGFDHRRLRTQLCGTFELMHTSGSPLGKKGGLLNSEIVYVMRKRL
jgi:SAM-dependent methyltransferase